MAEFHGVFESATEGVGFEPTEPLRVQRFSRPSQSTTLAPLRGGKRFWLGERRGWKVGRQLCLLLDRVGSGLHGFGDDILGDVNGNIGGDGDGQSVAGAGVDLNEVALEANAEFGEIGVVAQLGDEDVL